MVHKPTLWNSEDNHANRLIELARRRGVLRAADLEEYSIPRVYLTRLVADYFRPAVSCS